jgi:hypothetical protein
VDDPAAGLAGNASGLIFESATNSEGVLWSVNNNPPRINRLIRDVGTGLFVNDPDGWSVPRAIAFPSGSGDPDSEGITFAALDGRFAFVASESSALLGRASVLRFDLNDSADPLPATHEWNLSADLAGIGVIPGSNAGLEAITFIPDPYLTQNGLKKDDGSLYVPADYPDHYGGLFVVGVEANGRLFAYALMGDGEKTRIAEIPSGFPEIMSLEFDRELEVLWAGCDNNCDGAMSIIHLNGEPGSPTYGEFEIAFTVARPTLLANANHEGIAMAPLENAAAGFRPFFWVRDGAQAGSTLMEDAIPIGPPCR